MDSDLNELLEGNKLFGEMWKESRKDHREATKAMRIFTPVSIVAIILAVIAIGGCIYLGTVVHKQDGEIKAIQGEIKAIQQILDAGVVIEETTTTETTTTTQTVDGDEAVINNGDFEQYNDSAIKEEVE